jgi:hypothetical protein
MGELMSEQQIFAKCAWRLIPFMMLLMAINCIDRVNVGFAALTMNRDLGFFAVGFRFWRRDIFRQLRTVRSACQFDTGAGGRAALDVRHPCYLGHAFGRECARAHPIRLVENPALPPRGFRSARKLEPKLVSAFIGLVSRPIAPLATAIATQIARRTF